MQQLWGALERPGLALARTARTEAEIREFGLQLRARAIGATLWTDPSRTLAYAYDATGERHWPDAVVLIESPAQLREVLKVAEAFRMPVIGRGAGTSLSGGTTPIVGGIVLAFAKLNHLLEMDRGSREATVEPGLVNADFQDLLGAEGMFYAPDPSSHRISTLGGNASENSGGPHCLKYGVTTNHILGGTVYLVDGIERGLPTTRDWRPGLDITGLVVGSEGTLVLITRLLVQIMAKPPAVATLLAAFDRVETAADAVSAVIAHRIMPSTLELLDQKSIETIERFVHAGYPESAGAVLLVELDGAPEAVDADRATVEAILQDHCALTIQRADNPEDVERLWKGRRSAYGAAAQIAGHLWIQDVTVPRPLLADMMNQVTAIGESYGFPILTIAHAGDGNLHPNLPYNPSDPEEVARMRAADQEILRACVERGGSITGEHGIGIDKLEQLAFMFGPQELQVMADIKSAFDPLQLLNPGKAVLPVDAVVDRTRYPLPLSASSDGRYAALEAQLASHPPLRTQIVGAGHPHVHAPIHADGPRQVVSLEEFDRVLELDAQNLTVTVEAGVRAGLLRDILAEQRLRLPALPGNSHTVGGLVAQNARSWTDPGLGWRDHVLAVDWIDGTGRHLRFGRKTMKNVAGYDVAKLSIGSWGTLGAITRLTFRLRPQSAETLVAGIYSDDAAGLARLALVLGNAAIPPRGLLLQGSPEATVLWIAVDGGVESATVGHIETLAQAQGLVPQWFGPEHVDAIDQARGQLDRLPEPKGCWEGGVAPGALPDHVAALPSESRFFAYPWSGAIECAPGGAAAARPTWVRREHPARGAARRVGSDPWSDIEARIRTIFDPWNRFPAWEEGPNA